MILTPSDRNAIATIVAVFCAALSLKPLTTDMSYLPLAGILIVLVGGIGAVLRRLRMNQPTVIGAQALIVLVYLVGISVSLSDDGGWWGRVAQLYGGAIEHIQSEVAPLSPHPGVKLLFVTAVGLIALLVDILVSGIDRPSWAIIPMLSLYLIPALGLTQDISGWYLVLIGAGYLGLLFVESLTAAERWPRYLSGRRKRRGGLAASAGRMGVLIAVPVLGLALLVGSVVPLPDQSGWGFTRPSGSDGPLQLTDPTLDLRRNLSRPDNQQVLSYTTDQPDGTYLRMASLPLFDARGWQVVPMQLQTSPRLPPPPGVANPSGITRQTEIHVGDFRSEYLPLPYAPSTFEAPGDWAYDPISLVVLATGADRVDALRNLSYSVESVDIVPDGARLSAAGPGRPEDLEYTGALPPDLPAEIIDLTIEVTQDAESPVLKAAAIQAFLRSSEFTYSLDPQPGTGYQALENFLLNDRRGYCEQFAASMALMARIVGIPSRVSVGFLPGEQTGDGEWEVSLHDMHAWPELFFEGEGWVRFEPTPAVQAGNPPPWTIEGEEPQPSATAEPTEEPGEETPQPTQEASPTQSPEPTPSTEPEDADGSTLWPRMGIGALALIVVAGLALTPGLLRRKRRTSRLSVVSDPVDRVEAAWDEVHDLVIDHGHSWPDGTPRAIAAELGGALNAEGKSAMRRMGRLVERARFGPSLQVEEDLTALVTTIAQSIAQREDWDTRLIANWWPRSLFARLSADVRGLLRRD